jgi:predicted Zn-dependent peptidase
MNRRTLNFVVLIPVLLSAQVQLPDYSKKALPNGATLLLMEQREVPIISVAIALRTGSVADPAGKEGLADITNDLLRKGTQTRTADRISQELDFIGATLGTTVSFDATYIRAEFLKKDQAAGLALLGELVRSPSFPQDEVDKLLKQRVDGARARKDQAQGVIGEYFAAALFGAHPYGRPLEGDERSLKAITRQDIVRLYEQSYVGPNMIIAAAGDFSAAEMEKALTAEFGALPKKPAPKADAPKPAGFQGKKLLLVDKPDSTQTFFQIGALGIARGNPDRVAIDLVNTLFGGRFTSMLNDELRIKTGLTYGASASFSRRRERGPFVINSYTRNATTEKAIDLALDILKRLHEQGLTEAQLRSAKSYLKGQFGPRVETTDQLANWMADLELYGLAPGEVNDYAAKLDAVTLSDTRRIIQEYYPREHLVFVLIGKASEIEAVAKKYAPQFDKRAISDPGYR